MKKFISAQINLAPFLAKGIAEALMPSDCFDKISLEDLKAFGERSKFTDDLAVFRFRAFVTEKARTQKGQVSFENAYNIFVRKIISRKEFFDPSK